MNYSGLNKNDVVNGEGVCVSFWCQGCPIRCPGCHNPETWDFDGGKPLPADYKNQVISAISANGIQRNFSVLGGEPLCEHNIKIIKELILSVRVVYPTIKIFLWTGYEYEDLINRKDTIISEILEKIDVLITGPFKQELRDITLPLRGSTNQQVLYKGIDF